MNFVVPIPFPSTWNTREIWGIAPRNIFWMAEKKPWSLVIDGRFTPLPFKDMLDPATGRTRVRMVDIESESYKIARAYMARLHAERFWKSGKDVSVRENPQSLARTIPEFV